MPLSEIDGCSESHWGDVREIIEEAIIQTQEFEFNLVSDTDETTTIHKTIIKNLYDNPIVVCNISGKNPNVMFELGLRLAFDKPTIIIKDNQTLSSFDTSTIEYIEYPRDLRFSQIVSFKKKLSDKIKATYKKSQEDSDYSSFLRNFGAFTAVKIEAKEVSSDEYILDELRNIRLIMAGMERKSASSSRRIRSKYDVHICLRNIEREELNIVIERLNSETPIKDLKIRDLDDRHYHLLVDFFDHRKISPKRIQSICGDKADISYENDFFHHELL